MELDERKRKRNRGKAREQTNERTNEQTPKNKIDGIKRGPEKNKEIKA